MIPSHIRAKRAAYKALAAYRINANDREDIAMRVATILGHVPQGDLQGVAELGVHSGIAADLRTYIPIPTYRRAEAAAAAVGTAVAAMLNEES